MILLLPVAVATLIALAPIWRVAGSKQGYSAPMAAWKHYREVKHITIEEAKSRAREAYRLSGANVAT